MEKEQKKRYYSITYLICVVLLLSSIPFTMFINNELIFDDAKSFKNVNGEIYADVIYNPETNKKIKFKNPELSIAERIKRKFQA